MLQYATFGTLPDLDEKNRPKFAYGRTIHEQCPRRAHFDAGRFVQKFGDENARLGYCLYKMGCKGPATHANCSVQHFGEVTDAWPIGIGHPCFGCTEQTLGFRVAQFTTVDIDRPMPPTTYPPIHAPQGTISPVATGLAGLVGGALLGAGFAAARKLGGPPPEAARRRRKGGVTCRSTGASSSRASPRPERRRPPAGTLEARARPVPPPDALGLLYDTTRCIGCKACVVACRQANDTKPEPGNSPGGIWDTPMDLNGDTKTVIKLYKSADGFQRSFFKAQCMHCVDPACTNACMLGALKKGAARHRLLQPEPLHRLPLLPDGLSLQRAEVPVDVGRAEDRQVRALPPPRGRARRCRESDGFSRYPATHGPACAEVCPRAAVIYGTRDELLAEAKRRMAEFPDRYVPKIYGETDGGGTQCLYLSHVPFEDLGLPRLVRPAGSRRPADDPARHLPGIRRAGGALRPVDGGRSSATGRSALRTRDRREGGRRHERPRAGRGRPDPHASRAKALARAVLPSGAILILWRLVAGLGATTALSDGYPWGLWIAFDVVTGTALACGGYALALLVYILNKGRYHPMVRPAILTSALGYTLAAVSIVLDVGRPWLAWKIPLFVWSWNLHSALLEVALCIMTYTVVLWIELSPAFLERFREGPEGRLKRFSQKAYPIVNKALLFWIIALGMLLPTMHQSSLGTLMILTGPKLHPLWQTPFLPLLFLISCIAMGYAAVVFESTLATAFFRRSPDTDMLAALSGAMLPVLGAFLVLRVGDLASRGQLGLVFAADRFALAFWIEIALFAMPFVLLLPARRAPQTPATSSARRCA